MCACQQVRAGRNSTARCLNPAYVHAALLPLQLPIPSASTRTVSRTAAAAGARQQGPEASSLRDAFKTPDMPMLGVALFSPHTPR